MERQSDREINLSATLILGIFFALAVVCAVFFGFGYSVGRKSIVAGTGGVPVTAAAQVASPFGGFKPAAGSTATEKPGPTVTVPLEASAVVPRVPVSEGRESIPLPAETVTEPVAAADPKPAVAVEAGSMMVQVAAVSHQEDADLLVTTLKRRGYAVAIHNEPQDKLLHVQVGPFTSHKDADGMRQKLLADGFNAIVKEQK